MANKEHLAILKEGVEAWNEWRGKNPDVRPDLIGAYLSETSPEWADPDLPRGLGQADFKRADFRRALLKYTRLRGADLSYAELSGADLSGADLRRAELRGADLREAKLYHTNMTLANLIGANLARAIFWETVLARTNFTDALGMEDCRHGGPSIIDHRTLQRSNGVPETFLRGCGLPDVLIDSLSKWRRDSKQFHSCFISYSTKDREFAERLYADLQNKGVRCWFAPEDMKIADRFRDRIDEAVRLYDKLLLVLSESSIESPWVEDEVEAALEKERLQNRTVLFPIRLDDAVMTSSKAWAARARRILHIGDFRVWKEHDKYKKAFERLLKDLKAE
jgi:uncharacterized protein YjbI with pentapeptide repeats